jgi:hypothetical protein
MDLQEVGGGLGDWMDLAQDRDLIFMITEECIFCQVCAGAEDTISRHSEQKLLES